MINKLIIGMVMAGIATASQAATFTSEAGAPDPGALASETRVIDFNSGLPAGVTVTGNADYVIGSIAGQYATPAGDDTRYFVVPKDGTNGTATINFGTFAQGIKTFSVYFGSIDTYNTFELLNGVTSFLTVVGGDLPPGNGDQFSAGTNRRVFFTLEAGDILTGVRVSSSSVAFELDDISISAVPEPETWATLMFGLGLVGVTMRRRRNNRVAA